MDTGLSIEGLPELKKAFDLLPERVAVRAASNAVRKGAQIIQTAARAKCPVLTGNLRRSITIKILNKRRDAMDVVALIGPGAGHYSKSKQTRVGDGFYGYFVERGTKNMKAEPFMRPAYDENKGAAQQAIMDTIGEAIEAEAQKLYGGR